MKNGLYNRGAYGLPVDAAECVANAYAKLDYSQHAFRASRDDRYGSADLPGAIEIAPEDVVEVLVEDNRVAKAVVRFPFDDSLDLVFVLVPRDNYFVKTVWFNRADDKHKTLKLAPYSRP